MQDKCDVMILQNNQLQVSSEKSVKLLIEVLFLVCYALMIIFPAFRPVGMDRDSNNYAKFINDFVNSGYTIKNPGAETSFYVIAWISSKLFKNPVRGVLVIYAFVGLIVKFIAITRYSVNRFISLIVYLGFFYVVQDFNTIRASVSTGIFLLAFNDIKEQKFFKYLIKISIASLFHASALVLIFFYFVNKKNIKNKLYALIFIGIVLDFTNLNYKFIELAARYASGFVGQKLNFYMTYPNYIIVSKMRLIFNLGLAVILYVCEKMIGKDIEKQLEVYLNILKASVAFFFLANGMPVLAGRVSEMTSIYIVLLIPAFLKKIKKDEKWVIALLIILFCVILMCLYIKTDLKFSCS